MTDQGIAKLATPKAGRKQDQKLSWSSLRRDIIYNSESPQAKQLKCLLLSKNLFLVHRTRGLQDVASRVINLAG